MRGTITLVTDFQTVDGYAGEMKGVLLSRAPGARIVDVTHEIPAGDVAAGAWTLQRVWSRFPEGTVHLVVVDPGVGSDRRAVAVRAEGRWFVGPDNGLLTHVVRRSEVREVRRLAPGAMALQPLSDTFHGRDLFAPAAAHLAAGGEPEELGSRLRPDVLVAFDVADPERVERGDGDVEILGEVLHVDRFGNLVTNVPSVWLPSRPEVELGAYSFGDLGESFASVEPGEPVLIRGSGGTLEICVRGGSASEAVGAGRGASVRVRGVVEGRDDG